MTEYKQVIVVRTDLKMSRGKIAAQCCHASLEASEKVKKKNPELWKRWRRAGAKKVVLCVNDLKSLLELKEKAARYKVPSVLIMDKGLTEIPPSITCLGIGPSEEEKVNKITGSLKLLK